MVDHGVSTDEYFTILDETDLHPPLNFKRQFSTEGIKELLKDSGTKSKEPLSSSSSLNTKFKTTEKWDIQSLHDKLSKTADELLSRSPADYENTVTAKEIRSLEDAYKPVMEKFLLKMSKFRRSIKEMSEELKRTLKEFRTISRITAQVTLATSVTNVFLVMVGLAQKIFKYSGHPKLSLISNVVAGLSFTASLLTFSHMRRTTTDIASDLRKESRVLVDLLIAHRKGDIVDERVERLFPHGINLNFIDKRALETSNYFDNRYSWKKYLCTAIILTNIHKDATLLEDGRFLTAVKLFVENPSSEIWWSRIKIRRLLEKISQKADTISIKELLSAYEAHISRTAVYIYPLILPWFVSSWNTDEMRFFCSSIAGVLALMDLGNKTTSELDLKTISESFEKDFREITTICEILDCTED